MKRKTILGVTVFVLLVAVALRTQRNARRDLEYKIASVRITERFVDGYPERYSRWIPLAGYQAESGIAVDWIVSTSADPSRSPFTLTLRSNSTAATTWETEAKQSIALIADGRRYELKSLRSLGSIDAPATLMVCEGPSSTLAAVAGAKTAMVEFGDKRYELGDRGLANCRELLWRSRAAAKTMR